MNTNGAALTPRRRSCFVNVMRHSWWLRAGIVSVAVATTGLCAAVSACGDGFADSANGASDSGLTDTRPGDAQKDGGDAGPSANTARLTVVNATHDLGPDSISGTNSAIRFCFKQGSIAQNLSVAPYPPLPDRPVPNGTAGPPGIAAGGGATLPIVGLDLAGRIIVPIVMNARSLSVRGFDDHGGGQRAPTCDELVGDTADAAAGLEEGTDYWVLPQIAPGTLANDKAYVLALTGCVANAATPNPGKCGPGFVPGGPAGIGNLELTIYETKQSPVSASFGAQFLYLSTQANAFFSQATANNAIHPGFVSNPADGGGYRPIADVTPPLGALPDVVPVTDVAVTDAVVFGPKSLAPAEAALGMPLLPTSMSAMQQYSGLSATSGGSVYEPGRNYVVIAVGDPDTGETKQFLKPDGTPGGDGGNDGSRFNLRFFHFLAFPTDPVALPYTPP